MKSFFAPFPAVTSSLYSTRSISGSPVEKILFAFPSYNKDISCISLQICLTIFLQNESHHQLKQLNDPFFYLIYVCFYHIYAHANLDGQQIDLLKDLNLYLINSSLLQVLAIQ